MPFNRLPASQEGLPLALLTSGCRYALAPLAMVFHALAMISSQAHALPAQPGRSSMQSSPGERGKNSPALAPERKGSAPAFTHGSCIGTSAHSRTVRTRLPRSGLRGGPRGQAEPHWSWLMSYDGEPWPGRSMGRRVRGDWVGRSRAGACSRAEAWSRVFSATKGSGMPAELVCYFGACLCS